jgi:hypothetical protein
MGLSRTLCRRRPTLWTCLAFFIYSLVMVLSQQVDLSELTNEERIAQLEALLADARAAVPPVTIPRQPPARPAAPGAKSAARPPTGPPGGAPFPPGHGHPHPHPPKAGAPFPPPPPPRAPGDYKTATGYTPPPPLPPLPTEIAKFLSAKRAAATSAAPAAGAGAPRAPASAPAPPGGPPVPADDAPPTRPPTPRAESHESKDEL